MHLSRPSCRWLTYSDQVGIFNGFMLTCAKAAHGIGPAPTLAQIEAVQVAIRPLIEVTQANPPRFYSHK